MGNHFQNCNCTRRHCTLNRYGHKTVYYIHYRGTVLFVQCCIITAVQSVPAVKLDTNMNFDGRSGIVSMRYLDSEMRCRSRVSSAVVMYRLPWSSAVHRGRVSSAIAVRHPPWTCVVQHGRVSCWPHAGCGGHPLSSVVVQPSTVDHQPSDCQPSTIQLLTAHRPSVVDLAPVNHPSIGHQPSEHRALTSNHLSIDQPSIDHRRLSTCRPSIVPSTTCRRPSSVRCQPSTINHPALVIVCRLLSVHRRPSVDRHPSVVHLSIVVCLSSVQPSTIVMLSIDRSSSVVVQPSFTVACQPTID